MQDFPKQENNLLNIEFQYKTPIVGIKIKPRIKLKKGFCCIFSWHRIEFENSKSKIINLIRYLYISRTIC
jgi:hypothetical protein